MAEGSDDRKTGSDKGRKRPLRVVCSAGIQHRFLRGKIIHDLVQRGISFDDSYAVARTIRDRLSDRQEVSTTEIRELISKELEKIFGTSIPTSLRETVRPGSELYVLYHGHEQPFSRGLLARSVQAAGLDLDRAYHVVTELEAELRSRDLTMLPSGELARQVGDLLERMEGAGAASRYRMMRQIQRLPHPLVIYLGGASGTGKSTLALELAPLLRIYRINATDTIRQVMRMVFTPSILPALHISSFEVNQARDGAWSESRPKGAGDSEFEQRLIASFEEQATRVLVGVRAVVERAIAENMSIVVEGVHIHPRMVPFADLEGAAYQVPLVLATLDEEAHRTRFLTRSRSTIRLGERYLENFKSIRSIHDHILQQAEISEIPILDTSVGEPPVTATLRLMTGMLETRLPALATSGWTQAQPPTPSLLLFIDGLADRPVRALGGRTPLQAAKLPTFDRLAREGRCGLADSVAPGVVPDTAAGALALFGQSPLAMKRGPVEALGAGIALRPGDVALRGNFATLDEAGNVIDRRAGRIRGGAVELAAALDGLPLPGSIRDEVAVRVGVTTEHRLAVVLTGERLSSAIQGSDPGEGAVPGPPLVPRPDDPADERAVFTATALALFEQEARKLLATHQVNIARKERGLPAANCVLTRGAGRLHRILPLEEAGLPLRITCIGGDHTILGLARWIGAEAVTESSMTANLDTDLEAKFRHAQAALEGSDLVVIHLKGADIASHDQRPELKVSFLERVDEQLAKLLESLQRPIRLAVASDHATLSESGQHGADPTPILIWGPGEEPDRVQTFDEQTASAGSLGRFPLQTLLSRLFELS